MREIYTKIGLISQSKLKLDISNEDFKSRLLQNVDKEELGMFSESYDYFSDSNRKYKGEVYEGSFKLKQKHNKTTIANGRFIPDGDQTALTLTIYCTLNFFIPILVGLSISSFFLYDLWSATFYLKPAILLYVFQRIGIKKFKDNISNDLMRLTKEPTLNK